MTDEIVLPEWFIARHRVIITYIRDSKPEKTSLIALCSKEINLPYVKLFIR